MFMTAIDFLLLALSFVVLFFGLDIAIFSGLLVIGVTFAFCVVFLFKGTVHEVYCFDRSTDSHSLVRRFIHRRMFLTGVEEQTLREEVPLCNSFKREASIANAISSYLSRKR